MKRQNKRKKMADNDTNNVQKNRNNAFKKLQEQQDDILKIILTKRFRILFTLCLGLVLVGLEAITFIGCIIFEAGGWMSIEIKNMAAIWTILIAVNVIVALVLAAVLTRTMILPVRKLNKAMEEVTNGNFNVQLNVRKSGELGALLQHFNAMAARLKHVETLQTDFIADVSHEFKNPLASVQGYLEMLKREDLSAEERQNCFDVIENSVSRLSVLSSNILTLSKLNNQITPYTKIKYDLSEQLRRVVLSLAPEWQKKNVEFELELPDFDFYGVEELNWQVWYNLIQNAIKFSRENGVVKIEANVVVDGMVEVLIKDEGVGMTPDIKERIFDKFYQGDESRSKDGNGLGLAIVKNIVESNSGRILVESTLGDGSTFTVYYPLA